MASFEYQSLTSNGEPRNGLLTATDRAEALRVLMVRGETATRLEPVDERHASPSSGRRSAAKPIELSAVPGALFGRTGRPTLRRAELANLIRELATALEAGLPLMQSLKTVRRQARGRALPMILDHLIDRVEAGDPLYRAAAEYGRPFDDMVVGMLRAADASGEMSQVLHQLADLLERSVELRREVAGATIYPMIVAVLLAISVIVLVTVLVPRLLEPMMSEHGGMVNLPWPTEVVLGLADAIRSYWLPCLLLGAGGCAGWWAWHRVPANQLLVDRTKLRLPIIGRLLRDIAVARFTRTLGTLTSSGLPLLDALRITRNTLGNHALMAAIDEVQDQVTGGKSLADPLERSGLFPPLLVQVVGLGERSGRLDTMLVHAAGAFDRQVNASLKLFSKALPPLLLIVMAGAGGFVLAAILLPMLELQNLVQ